MTLLETLAAWAQLHGFFFSTTTTLYSYGVLKSTEVVITEDYCEMRDGTRFGNGEIILMATIPAEMHGFIGIDLYPPIFADNQLNGFLSPTFTSERLMAFLEAEEKYAKEPHAKTYHSTLKFR